MIFFGRKVRDFKRYRLKRHTEFRGEKSSELCRIKEGKLKRETFQFDELTAEDLMELWGPGNYTAYEDDQAAHSKLCDFRIGSAADAEAFRAPSHELTEEELAEIRQSLERELVQPMPVAPTSSATPEPSPAPLAAPMQPQAPIATERDGAPRDMLEAYKQGEEAGASKLEKFSMMTMSFLKDTLQEHMATSRQRHEEDMERMRADQKLREQLLEERNAMAKEAHERELANREAIAERKQEIVRLEVEAETAEKEGDAAGKLVAIGEKIAEAAVGA